MRRRDVLEGLDALRRLQASCRVIGARGRRRDELYDIGTFGNARMLHMTDTHAQLTPVYFREPSVNLGIGAMAGKPPHLVGQRVPRAFRHRARRRGVAHAFTFLDFAEVRARVTAGWAASRI